MFGYSLVVGVILVTSAFAIPVGNQDQEVDSAFLRRPSLEDELRDLPYDDLPKMEDDGNVHDASLNHAEENPVAVQQNPAVNVVSSVPAAPPPSHLIDIDSNIHQSALSSSSAVEGTATIDEHPPEVEEREWRPEDDEKDDEDDANDSSPDDEADDDDEEDDETDEVTPSSLAAASATYRPPTGDVINSNPSQYTPAANDDAANGGVVMSVEKKPEADHEKRTSSRQPPAYIREAYFLAKEDKTESSVAGVGDEQQSSVIPDQSPPDSHTSEEGTVSAIDSVPNKSQPSSRHQVEGSGGQKEQFAEVVVKLAEDDDHHHYRDFRAEAAATTDAPVVPAASEHDVNGNDDENNNNGGGGADPTSATQHQHRMGDPEVSHGNNQNHENRGSSPTVTDDGNEEPVAMAVAAAPSTTTTTTTENESTVAQTAVSEDDNDDIDDDDEQQRHDGAADVDELESELEAEEGRIKDEISERERSIGAGKRLVKKVVPMDTQKMENAAEKDESANEDILELIIKVAERPSSWKEIKELLEKIQYEENTLNKAKARLRALAKQKQMKNRKEQRNKENKLGKNRTKYNPNKNLHNGTLPNKEHNFNRAEITPGEQPKAGGGHRITINADSQHHGNRHHQMAQQPAMARVPLLRNNNNDDIIKAAVFPSATAARHTAHSDDNGKHPQHAKQHHGSRRPSGGSSDEHDFAIEKPVTVIGERSRIDPVEKELIEASTNQRLREIQIEKARLAAIPEPTDEMERQLKALTKMERRLKEHWRQKQKLIQKIRETNEEHAKW